MKAEVWQQELTSALIEDFSKCRIKNPRYSLRAYSRKMKLSPSSLSLILRGKQRWKLKADRAAQIVSLLNASFAEKKRLLALMDVDPSELKETINKKQRLLLLTGLYTPLLMAHDLPKEQKTLENLAERFSLDIDTVDSMRMRLLKENLLIQMDDGEIVKNPATTLAEEGLDAERLRKYHGESLRRALDVVESPAATVPKDISTITFAGSSETIEIIKKEIRIFQEKMKFLMSKNEHADEVLCMSVCLFPIRGQYPSPEDHTPEAEPKA